MNEWPLVRLADVAKVGAGNSAPQDKALFEAGTHPFFRTADVGRVKVGELSIAQDHLNDRGIKGLKLHPAGTVLIPKSGASTFLDHRVIMAVDGYVSSHLATLYANEDLLDRRYLFWIMQTISARDVSADTSYPTLSLGQINDILIPLPTLEKQRRIVAVLDEAFAAIASATANAEKNLASARELFEQAIKDALSGAAADWKVAPFEECLDPIKYPAKVQRKAFLAEGVYPIVSQEAAFINGYWDNPQDLVRVPRPLVVFGDHTQVLKYVDFDFVLGADGVKLLLPKPPISGKFLYYFLKANPLPSAGYARHYRHLKSLTVGYPPLAEQHAITDRLDEIGAAIEELEGVYRLKIETLSELKQSLLHRAFSGELTERERLAA